MGTGWKGNAPSGFPVSTGMVLLLVFVQLPDHLGNVALLRALQSEESTVPGRGHKVNEPRPLRSTTATGEVPLGST